MIRAMPAKPALESRATDVLTDPESANYGKAKQIVAAATSLKQAVLSPDPQTGAGGSSFFLGNMSAADQDEIKVMLDRLPRNVDGGVLGELKTALQNDAKIVFQWQPHPNGDVFDHNAWTDPNDGTVQIVLRTPPGPARTPPGPPRS